MTSEERAILREEAASFLAEVQELDGFNARREELNPPELALKFPLRAIRRVLLWPQGTGLLLLDADEDGEIFEIPRPGVGDFEVFQEYERRLARFAQRYLSRTQWGARATHEALRRAEPIMLPRAAPDVRIPLGDKTISGAKLERIAEVHRRQVPELRRDRSKTWSRALAATEARLKGQPSEDRYAFQRAARYLNAAVNGTLGKVRDVVPPLEATDDPNYEEGVEERQARNERLDEIRRAQAGDLDFDETLSHLLGLVGTPVDVAIADADGSPPVVASSGGILHRGMPLDAEIEGGPGEAIVFTIEHGGTHVEVLSLHRSRYTGAKLQGDELRVVLGDVALTIEPG